MDFDTAQHQRLQLDFIRGLQGLTPLMKCDDGTPCMDHRCPQCGSDLQGTLNRFTINHMPKRLRMKAFALPDTEIKDGVTTLSDLSIVRAAVGRIISHLASDILTFLATMGIVYDMGDQKMWAIELCYAGARNAPDDHATLQAVVGQPLSVVPFAPDRHRYVAGTAGFREYHLYGYTERMMWTECEPDPIMNAAQIGEIAQNYGERLITDRVMSFGVGVVDNKLIRKPGCTDQILLTDFGDMKIEA